MFNQFYISGLIFLAGISAYSAIQHFAYKRWWPQRRVHLLFAAIALLVSLHSLSFVLLSHATTVATYLAALRANLAIVLMLITMILWFFAEYSNVRPLPVLAGFSILFALLFFVNLIQPYTLQYRNIHGLGTLTLPWGEHISFPQATAGVWCFITVTAILLAIVFTFYPLAICFRRDRRRTALFMIFAVGLVLITTFLGVLARLGILHFIPLGPFGYLGMIVIMGLTMSYEMQEERRYMETLLDHLPAQIFMKDSRGRYMVINRHYEETYNVSRKEVYFKTAHDIFPREQAEVFHAQDQQVLATRHPIEQEEKIVTNRGTRTYFVTKIPLLQNDGVPYAICGIGTDITGRTMAEESLRRSEEKFAKAFQATPMIYLISSMRNGRLIEVNEAFEKVMGYTREEAIASTTIDLGVWVDIAERERLLQIIRANGRLQSKEVQFCTKSGEVITCLLSVESIELDGEECSLSIAENITSRKQAEQALRENEERLQALTDVAPIAITWATMEGDIKYCNPRFSQLFGYTIDDIPTINEWRRLAYPDPVYRETIPSGFAPGWRQGEQGVSYDATVMCKDGSQRHVIELRAATSTMFVLMLDDITERKSLEVRLLQAQKLEAIGTLAGGVAHDFNNLLTAIIGFSTLLQMDTEEDDPRRAYISEILTASDKAVNLTRSLLAFSRKQKVDLRLLDTNEAILNVTKLLKRLLTEDIELTIKLCDRPLTVMADPTQIDQVLINLATNARDAMPRGGTLRIATRAFTLDDEFGKVHGYGKPGAYAHISVADTGTGMDVNTQKNIFDPFFTTKEVGKGTGLGLSMVYGIMKQHSGYINLVSEPGQGTTFSLYLPLADAVQAETTVAREASPRGTETILIAEDDEGIRGLATVVLERHGYTVLAAKDGREAVRIFRKNNDAIDLVILDVVMPKMNGKQTCEEIMQTRPDVRVLFTSGYAGDVVIDKGVHGEQIDFIAKPLQAQSLLLKVREVLDR